ALLGRDALAELEDVGDPVHLGRVLAKVGLALAESGRVTEALDVLAELRGPEPQAPADGPAAIVEAAIALRRGEEKRAAESFAAAAEAYAGGHDPRDTVEALVGVVRSTPDAERRQEAVARLAELCRTGGITLLPRERELLGPEAVRGLEEQP
ncbi:XRE family transcriptional regulator, partial [Actinoplanes sp. NPDC048791]